MRSIFTLRFTTLFFSILFFYSFNNCDAQDNSKYSLLWKIEGNDALEPSYLFGTMHVDDAKAFNFSDAVMPAIEASKYFALEIHPDDMMNAYSKKTYDVSAYDFFKALLSKKDFEELQERYQEMNGVSLLDSGIEDPNTVLSAITPDPDKKDDKSTFVDMYLYEIAATLQRELVGLEDPLTQIDHFEKLSNDEKIKSVRSYLDQSIEDFTDIREEMADIYSTGDLDKIVHFGASSVLDDPYFIGRNEVMRNSIMAFIKKGSIFAAVGAAHLPGENGLISLLQKEGFSVTRVPATFTGVSDNYTIDESKKRWHTFRDSILNYSVQIPKAPNYKEDFGLFQISGYGDMFNNRVYMFMGMEVTYTVPDGQEDSLCNLMIENVILKQGGTVVSNDKKQLGDRLVYNIEATDANGAYIKSRLIYKNNYIYYFQTNSEVEDAPSVNRFLKSIDVIGHEKKDAQNTEWTEYTYNEAGFTITLPTPPKYVKREHPNPLDPASDPYILNLYISPDAEQNANYIFRYNDHPLGYYTLSGNAMFEESKQLYQGQGEILNIKTIELQGFEGREYEVMLQNKYHAFVRMYVRGNRTYLLLKQSTIPQELITTDDRFFSEFTLLPFKAQDKELKAYETPAFSIDLFKAIKTDIDSTSYNDIYIKNSNDYYSKNPKSGGVYQLAYSDLRPYFRLKSKTKFLEEYKEGLLNWNDSIVNEHYIVKGLDSTLQISIKNKSDVDAPGLTQYNITLNEGRLFLIASYITDEEVESGISKQIISSLKPKYNPNKIDIYISKVKRIITDLKASDSLIQQQAIHAFDYYEFEQDELPKLYKALENTYPNDNTHVIHQKIVNEFSNINDIKTVSVLERLYLNDSTSEDTKALILGTLQDIETGKPYDSYFELIKKHIPQKPKKYNYSILRPLRDSTALAFTHFSTLKTLLQQKELRDGVLNIVNNIAKDSTLSDVERKDVLEAGMHYFESDWNFYKSQDSLETKSNMPILAYINLLNDHDVQLKAIDAITQDILSGDYNKWLQLRTLLARINNKLIINDDIFQRYINDYYTRFEFMQGLMENSDFKKVPKAYLENIEYAKLSLYNYFADDYGNPKRLEYLGTLKEGNRNFASFKVTYSSDDTLEDYLAVAEISPIILNKDEFAQFDCYSDWELIENDWETQAKQLIEAYTNDN